MKDKKEAIKCASCQHCSGLRPLGNTRTSFTCSHPDQDYIKDYFHEKRMQKMPGFLGFGAKYSDAVPIKTAPAWCPEKRHQQKSEMGNTRFRNNRGDAAYD